MGDIPEIASTCRKDLQVAVPPAWADHRFMGRVVLPAVAAMGLLADCAGRFNAGLAVTQIQAASFDKFLEIPPQVQTLNAFCDLAERTDGAVAASLVTRMKTGSAGFMRTKVHATAVFARKTAGDKDGPEMNAAPPVPEDTFSVDPERIYAELVPFGPAFRNIAQPLKLTEAGALAEIQAPDGSLALEAGPLGSPFVPDAAFHAACVWAQRFAGVVAFPVGIDLRRVLIPTRAGERYACRVIPRQVQPPMLIFDLWIYDVAGKICEILQGVHMRDVSGGRLKPPAWIKVEGCCPNVINRPNP